MTKNNIGYAVTFLLVAAAIAAVTPIRTLAQYASPVNVMNNKGAAAWKRGAESGARQPFAFTQDYNLPASTVCGGFAPPSNGVAVIEQVGIKTSSPTAVHMVGSIQVTTNGVTTNQYLTMTDIGPSVGLATTQVVERRVQLYADSGSGVNLCVSQGGAGNAFLLSHFTASGYTVTP